MQTYNNLLINSMKENYTVKFLLTPKIKIIDIKKVLIEKLSKFGKILRLNYNIIENTKGIVLITIIYNKVSEIKNFSDQYGYWENRTKYYKDKEDNSNYYVVVKNFNEKNERRIFNLFSSFGNIKEILIHKFNVNYFIVNYISLRGYIFTKDSLNKKNYKGKIIEISLKKNKSNLKNNYFNIYKYKNFDYRFKTKNNYKINTPNKLVYFFNIKNEFTVKKFFNLIKTISDLIKFKVLKHQNKLCYLVLFPNIELAFNAIMNFHNKRIKFLNKSFKLKVEFSHSKYN